MSGGGCNVQNMDQPVHLEIDDFEFEEVHAEDSSPCTVSYPECPTFSPSADDISRLKFVANEVVMWRSDEAGKCLENDISTYLNDRSIGPGSILSEKDREMYIHRFDR